MSKQKNLIEASQNVTFDTDGNVGIGTSSPSAPLDVVGSPGTLAEFRDGVAANFIVETAGAVTTIGNQAGSSALAFKSADTEAMRIDNSGRFLVGMTSPSVDTPGFYVDFTGTIVACRDSSDVAIFNRNGNDGTIILFRQGTSNEGTISVSGSTVSYNGGHLARWSQTSNNTRITGLLKGTVLTNLDQMAEWTENGVTEDNEQLNCMAVSSVEGDPNVSGVFVNWDDDDETYTADMNVAMTGDMIIRIAQGTTVARGDLLMSAGDGTAKPQGDDIVRSKTIAKVTSTHVSHTYDDGSYCVPCVLMAC